MKKVILILLVALSMLGNHRIYANNAMPEDGIKITINIEFGLPVTCFINWRICNITLGSGNLAATAEFLQGSDEKFAGGGGGGGGAGSWLVNIPRNNFAKYFPGFLSKLDGQNSVTFEGAYTLTPDVKNALGSTRDLVIKGNVAYPLKYENGVYTITFPQ